MKKPTPHEIKIQIITPGRPKLDHDPNTIVYFRMKEVEQRVCDVISMMQGLHSMIQAIHVENAQILTAIGSLSPMKIDKRKWKKEFNNPTKP